MKIKFSIPDATDAFCLVTDIRHHNACLIVLNNFKPHYKI